MGSRGCGVSMTLMASTSSGTGSTTAKRYISSVVSSTITSSATSTSSSSSHASSSTLRPFLARPSCSSHTVQSRSMSTSTPLNRTGVLRPETTLRPSYDPSNRYTSRSSSFRRTQSLDNSTPDSPSLSTEADTITSNNTSNSYSNSVKKTLATLGDAGESVTPESAQRYLTGLLNLPPDRQFSPELSIQILTHKSYRWTHLPGHGTPQRYSRTPTSSARLLDLNGTSPVTENGNGGQAEAWFAAHNGRLAFLGRRAIATYFPLFIHSAVRSGGMRLEDLDFCREQTLAEKIDRLRDTSSLGGMVGNPWGVSQVMRWDGNSNALRNGAKKIKGTIVEATLGAVFSEFGSPAAQRLFHLRFLPLMERGLRDPFLVERALELRNQVEAECGKGQFVLPSEWQPSRLASDIERGMELSSGWGSGSGSALGGPGGVRRRGQAEVEDVIGEGGRLKVPDLEAEVEAGVKRALPA